MINDRILSLLSKFKSLTFLCQWNDKIICDLKHNKKSVKIRLLANHLYKDCQKLLKIFYNFFVRVFNNAV